MKNWKELAGAVCLLALLGGCGIKHGVVTAKSYEAAYTYYMDQCYSYRKDGSCSLNVPTPQNVPEHFVLELRENDKTGDV